MTTDTSDISTGAQTSRSGSTATSASSMGLDESQPSHPLAEAGQEAVDSAGQLASRAADIGLQQADRGRELAASGLQSAAASIRRVSLDMEVDQPAIANVAETAAAQAERVATYLRETDARQIISNVEQVARRQPILFLGGAFVLGVVASRFIKAAGGERRDSEYGTYAVGRGYGAGTTYASAGTGARNGNEGS
jgi:hypothetical protein